MIEVKIYPEVKCAARRIEGDGTLGSGKSLRPIWGYLIQMPAEGSTIFIKDGWSGVTVLRSYMTLDDPVGQVSVEVGSWSDAELLAVGFEVDA